MGEFHKRRQQERAARRIKGAGSIGHNVIGGATVHVIDLGIDATNEDIIEQMRHAKHFREQGMCGRKCDHVVCTIRGFHDDPRELWEIPEVRAFCRRLVGLAFISYLDVYCMFRPKFPGKEPMPTAPPPWDRSFGAAEVWFCGEGLIHGTDKFPTEIATLKRFFDELNESNARADALLGPMIERQT